MWIDITINIVAIKFDDQIGKVVAIMELTQRWDTISLFDGQIMDFDSMCFSRSFFH